MRTKLIAVFIAALAVAAFGALPAVAMAEEEVTLETESEVLPTSTPINAFSSNFTFTSMVGEVACAESTLEGMVTQNPGAEIEFESQEPSRFFGGGMTEVEGSVLCPVLGTAGRFEVRLKHLSTGALQFKREGGKIHGRLTVAFEAAFYDLKLTGNFPIPLQECRYEGNIRVSDQKNGNVAAMEETVGLTAERNVFSPLECLATSQVNAGFMLTAKGQPMLMS